MHSKWNYIACGVNAIVALLGAVTHSLSLTLIGGIFIVWNWYIAEYNRSKENESIRQEGKSESSTETKE